MYNIKTFNNISPKGLHLFEQKNFPINSDQIEASAIILRSYKLQNEDVPDNIQVIARAGVGVNNIPIEHMTKRGIPVLNTPGANANAVKELVLAALLLENRNLFEALNYVNNLNVPDELLSKEVEDAKKKFVGNELTGKTLGVIGLGAIGVMVANAAHTLDINVIGYDPYLTLRNSWRLSPAVELSEDIDQLLAKSDYVTIHVPLIESTKNFIDFDKIKAMKKSSVLINFSRAEIVNNDAVVEMLKQNHLRGYVCDFPSNHFKGMSNVIALPHLGASTRESEENCATMAAEQIIGFLNNGEIINSVNFPTVTLSWDYKYRLLIANENKAGMISQISDHIAAKGFNIASITNKARENIAYTVIDLEQDPGEELCEQIKKIDGVIRLRKLTKK